MVELYDGGAYLIGGKELVKETEPEKAAALAGASVSMQKGSRRHASCIDKEEARKGTMAYSVLAAHNTSGDMGKLKLKFDALTSHDITFVGIIQTAKASGMERFPIPYVLTNCHNSLCAVGGTINEDDHVFGLTAAKHYGGIFVPPHMAVIHQYMREMMAGCGKMILGSDSHTRYGALGTMAVGEGGGELVKQLLSATYDISYPGVVAVYLEGRPAPEVGPHDVALAIVGAVFKSGYVKNKVMEFVGPGVSSMDTDYRNSVDVMTTETTCLSSIWRTDEDTKRYLAMHGRAADYREMNPADVAYYDGVVRVDLSSIRPMIAVPFHPSNVYEIDEFNRNAGDILRSVEKEAARISGRSEAEFRLTDKLSDGRLMVSQGVIAGCAGGNYSNVMAAAHILRGKSCGSGLFNLSVYPSSQPVFMDLVKKGAVTELMAAGAAVKTAFCGPCFGAGDTPANNTFSIRHTTRNFPNREGSKPGAGQMAAVALMDARSIAATAANGGYLTSAAGYMDDYRTPEYEFDGTAYQNRVYQGYGRAEAAEPVVYGPNIKDWPQMSPLADNILLKVCAKIMDEVTTTDELIPSGETSSYRSNPLGLAEFTLSRRDPDYVGRAKEINRAETARRAGQDPADAEPALAQVFAAVSAIASGEGAGSAVTDGENAVSAAVSGEGAADGTAQDGAVSGNKGASDEIAPVSAAAAGEQATRMETEIGSVIYAKKPGDGSAREQAASCQRVLGGLANIAKEYATKRYRSNVMNWGMLPFLLDEEPEFEIGDYIYIPGIRKALHTDMEHIPAYVIRVDGHSGAASVLRKLNLHIAAMTDDEKAIVKAGCLINYNRDNA